MSARTAPARTATSRPKRVAGVTCRRRAAPEVDISVPQTLQEIEYLSHQPMKLGSAVVDPAAQLLTVPEVAKLLRLSRATVYKLLQRGELSSYKIGVARRISLAALQAYISSTGIA